ncbi:helix-turn-helix domain-containing protein [Thiotrichales bacterium 19S3-7]|nr:helix-turn-helix domain-containing protein [Thiotrichales bacterium 19S3-7]MCF6802800.1 helix-turn-helix domain-containing protein [Thiotrichales bacterium 19S3-11]
MQQLEAILKHLQRYGSITPLEALDKYGCLRLGARIYELRRQGIEITTEISKSNKHYAIYKLTYSQNEALLENTG